MALSDKRILEEKRRGNIVITPFQRKHLCTSSYDVCLGEFFYREEESKFSSEFFDPYRDEDVERVWGKPQKAPLASSVLPPSRLDKSGVSSKDRVVLLQPGETILGHTQEFIGGRKTITTMMKARSSMGRVFITVCKCAGWGDVGYINRWTMEITNNSPKHSIPLIVESRVAQIIFFETGPILNRDYSKSGAYQTSADLEKLKRSWKPEMMLPRLRR